MVNNQQIISSNTRYVGTGSGEVPAAEIPSIVATPLSETATGLPMTRPAWILPVLIVSIGLMALIVWRGRNQSRTKIK